MTERPRMTPIAAPNIAPERNKRATAGRARFSFARLAPSIAAPKKAANRANETSKALKLN